jgi:hypothetical protein
MIIEIQDIRDAEIDGIKSPHRIEAEKEISNGKFVKILNNGEAIGLASTIEELKNLIDKR